MLQIPYSGGEETMRRREFITLLGGAAATLCSEQSRAQQPSKTYTIGYLAPARVPHAIEALQDGLRKFGYIEGQNLKIEYRFLQGAGVSADELAAELVQLGPDVIVAVATSMAIPAKRATTTIPIVMAPVLDPLRAGIVTSLARPGGNITGTTLFGPELGGKRVEVFKQAVPGITRIAVLGNERSPTTPVFWQETQTAARRLGLEARLFTVQDPGELSTAFEAMGQDSANGVVVLADALFNGARQTIIALAAKHRLPAIYEGRHFVEDGGLVSYGPNIAEMTRRAAAFVDKIFRGAKPGDLPVEQPTGFELVINLKTAKALGLAIPDKLLATADEVIE
jgi:putative tryptophan/tyrosine transport system substrate-binding protein